VLILDGRDDLKLDSTASHPSSSSHSLPRHVVCHRGQPVPTADDHGWSGSTASVHMLRLLLLLAGSLFRLRLRP